MTISYISFRKAASENAMNSQFDDSGCKSALFRLNEY